MKILKIISVSILLFTAECFSQVEKKADSSKVEITKLGIGVKAGFNFATVSRGNLDISPDARTGFYLGINYEYPIIKDVFSIQPEMLFSQQGFEKRYTVSGERQKSIYKVDYLNIPILARYYVVRGFSFEAGPQFGYKVSEEFDRNETDSEIDSLTNANDFDFSFAAGITFQFDEGLFINGRYNRSFNEIIDGSSAKNIVIQLGLGFKF